MKNIFKICFVLTLFAFVSCKKDEVQKPKVIYKTPSKSDVVIRDSSQVLVADLPIQMPGTNYLIYPIASMNIYEKNIKASYGSSSNGNEMSFKISNYSEFEITGYLQNLKFQEVNSDALRALTDKPVLIQTVTYLKSVFDKAKQNVLIYTLADSDTNRDGKLDSNDIKSIYISDISGENFTKLSLDFQELIDWNLVESKNRLYFRTVEDTNKNGKFDKNDVIHYHFADLNNKDWKVSDYSPI